MQLSRRSLIAAAAAAALAPRGASATDPLAVVATTGMIADAARRIAGPDAVVQGLMGPGVDPHAYRQTRTDVAAMVRADLVLWHGLYLEAQMEEFLLGLGRRMPVRAVAEALPADVLISHPTYQGRYDPHVWMDPALWQDVVAAVQEALAAVRPDRADRFASAAEAHRAEIARLGDYAREVLASVPAAARVLVTAHDAFGYFGRAFDFEVVGIQGISTESEAGLHRIGEVVDLLVDRGIGAVFVESSVSDRNIRALVEGAAARGHEVRIGGELFSDAMGAQGSYEGTYVGMIDHNVTTIAAAFGGAVPPGGMDGKLAMAR